jgi:hypothetical protein
LKTKFDLEKRKKLLFKRLNKRPVPLMFKPAQPQYDWIDITFQWPTVLELLALIRTRRRTWTAFGHGGRGPETPRANGWKLRVASTDGMVRKT